jgi:Cdc6-like AAA superfamily ATPase
VQRPDVKAEIEKIISAPAGIYHIIVGNHGTGKTTIVEQIAREKSGVLYISIRGDEKDPNAALYQALENALLGDRYPTSLLGEMWKYINNGIPLHQSTKSDYRDLLIEFEQLAARFQSEHGRPAVLIFDNIDLIARDPKLLYRLQKGAKAVATRSSSCAPME